MERNGIYIAIGTVELTDIVFEDIESCSKSRYYDPETYKPGMIGAGLRDRIIMYCRDRVFYSDRDLFLGLMTVKGSKLYLTDSMGNAYRREF